MKLELISLGFDAEYPTLNSAGLLIDGNGSEKSKKKNKRFKRSRFHTKSTAEPSRFATP